MVTFSTRFGELVHVPDHVAQVSTLFVTMMEEDVESHDTIPLPWTLDEVTEVVRILTLTAQGPAGVDRLFPDVQTPREMLTKISTVLPLLDFIDARPVLEMMQGYITLTFIDARTPDDVIRLCFDAAVYAGLTPTQQSEIYETCLAYIQFQK